MVSQTLSGVQIHLFLNLDLFRQRGLNDPKASQSLSLPEANFFFLEIFDETFTVVFVLLFFID